MGTSGGYRRILITIARCQSSRRTSRRREASLEDFQENYNKDFRYKFPIEIQLESFENLQYEFNLFKEFLKSL